jgi:hypothetical protein
VRGEAALSPRLRLHQHGKKNPEGGIRRWAEAEYAEQAIKTKYPKGVPDNLSDNEPKSSM